MKLRKLEFCKNSQISKALRTLTSWQAVVESQVGVHLQVKTFVFDFKIRKLLSLAKILKFLTPISAWSSLFRVHFLLKTPSALRGVAPNVRRSGGRCWKVERLESGKFCCWFRWSSNFSNSSAEFRDLRNRPVFNAFLRRILTVFLRPANTCLKTRQWERCTLRRIFRISDDFWIFGPGWGDLRPKIGKFRFSPPLAVKNLKFLEIWKVQETASLETSKLLKSIRWKRSLQKCWKLGGMGFLKNGFSNPRRNGYRWKARNEKPRKPKKTKSPKFETKTRSQSKESS